MSSTLVANESSTSIVDVAENGDLQDIWRTWSTSWKTATGRMPIAYLSCGTETTGTIALEWSSARRIAAELQSTDGPVDLILRLRAGSLPASEYLSKVCIDCVDDLRVVVVDWCSSAGALLAASASSIAMQEHSYMGSLVPQVRDIVNTDGIGSDAATVLAQWIVDTSGANELIAEGGVPIRQLARSLQWCHEVRRSLATALSARKYEEHDIERIAEVLFDPTIPHDAPLFADRLIAAGLRVAFLDDLQAAAIVQLSQALDIESLQAVTQQSMRAAVLLGSNIAEPILVTAGE